MRRNKAAIASWFVVIEYRLHIALIVRVVDRSARSGRAHDVCHSKFLICSDQANNTSASGGTADLAGLAIGLDPVAKDPCR
jgi:hypothetical protein